mmetsp:Transcript_70715/g.188592  ORF Transcript_70715/g.188592 Transcript_70715/m.188592 type:complete len:348 (-) Transcript_70715:88-1131(-)
MPRSRSRKRTGRSGRRGKPSSSDSHDSSRERERRRRRQQAKFVGTGDATQGKFWDGYDWVEKSKLGQPAKVANQTKKARRIFVGNVPRETGISEEQMLDALYKEMISRGLAATDHNPIVSLKFSREDPRAGFLMMDTPQSAEHVLQIDGWLMLPGNPIQLRRHDHYAPTLDTMAELGIAGAKPVGASTGIHVSGSPGQPALPDRTSPLPALPGPPAPAVGPQLPPPLPILGAQPQGVVRMTAAVIRIQHALDPQGHETEDDYLDVLDDMELGCSKHGRILSSYIVRPKDAGMVVGAEPGDVFIQLGTVGEAQAAVDNMAPRKYEQRFLNYSSVDERLWNQVKQLILQ